MSKPFSKLNFSLPFSMETAVPVDYNSFFTSYDEASAAASTAMSAGSNESIYYIGQQLYVVDDMERTVKTYLISHDKTLTDIGKVYTFTNGLSSEYLSASEVWNVGIDTTNIVAPSDATDYLKFADAKKTYEELEEKLPLELSSGTTAIVLPYDDHTKSYLVIKDSDNVPVVRISSQDSEDGNIVEFCPDNGDCEVRIPQELLFITGNKTLGEALTNIGNSLDSLSDTKFDSVAAYPDWKSKSFDAWAKDEICSWKGKLYICTDDEHWVGQSNISPDESEYWDDKSLKDIISNTDGKFSYYLPLSGGTMTGRLTLSGTGDFENFLQIIDDNLNVRYRTSGITIAGNDYLYTIALPVTSGTLALTSAYLSGYGIIDAYTKAETMSSIDGNGRFTITDVTPFIETGIIPLKPYSAETLSADGSDLTFAFIGLDTFDTTHRYYKGESVWYSGSPYKCSVESIGTWDSSKFERIYRELLVDIDCTGIDDTGFEITWPSTIDVFGGSTSADMSPVSGEHNVYRITEYRDGYFSLVKIGGNGTFDKITELSLLVAKNTENIAENTSQIVRNSNITADLTNLSGGWESARSTVESLSADWSSAAENSLLIARNAENNASNTLQNVTNYNLIMELYRERE